MFQTNNDKCVICLEEMTETTTFVMSCCHKLHRDCFQTYFYYNYDIEANSICCPICRHGMEVERIENKTHQLHMMIQIMMYLIAFSFFILGVSCLVSSLEID